jgi:hypothetical protein
MGERQRLSKFGPITYPEKGVCSHFLHNRWSLTLITMSIKLLF